MEIHGPFERNVHIRCSRYARPKQNADRRYGKDYIQRTTTRSVSLVYDDTTTGHRGRYKGREVTGIGDDGFWFFDASNDLIFWVIQARLRNIISLNLLNPLDIF